MYSTGHPTLAASPARDADARLFSVLDRWEARLGRCTNRGGDHVPVSPIVRALIRYRAEVQPEEWRDTVGRLRRHPMVCRFYEDPYTRWGYHKPRGYPGDAVLLDFIYGGGKSTPLLAGASPFGAGVYSRLMEHPASAALRARREHLGRRLREVFEQVRRPRILAVACGHLREADWLAGTCLTGTGLTGTGARAERFVALDQDAETLETAQANHPGLGLEAVRNSVLWLLRERADLGKFDFIYSAGLYDYLSDGVGRRLTTRLAAMLAPGGRLLIANMMPDLTGAAYMEGVMDWWLIYRTLGQFRKMTAGLGREYTVSATTRRCVAYLEIGR